jgi:hypothetical protein
MMSVGFRQRQLLYRESLLEQNKNKRIITTQKQIWKRAVKWWNSCCVHVSSNTPYKRTRIDLCGQATGSIHKSKHVRMKYFSFFNKANILFLVPQKTITPGHSRKTLLKKTPLHYSISKLNFYMYQFCGSGIRPLFWPKDPGSGIIFSRSRIRILLHKIKISLTKFNNTIFRQQ